MSRRLPWWVRVFWHREAAVALFLFLWQTGYRPPVRFVFLVGGGGGA